MRRRRRNQRPGRWNSSLSREIKHLNWNASSRNAAVRAASRATAPSAVSGLGCVGGVEGVICGGLLPWMGTLNAEIRQYCLLLSFAALAAYLSERALAENSAGLMVLASAAACLAMFSNYSGTLFALALGMYS